ncbi:MAG: 30S ribosome-binding factor RbfA [Puniceicoccales bacterium]|jgi:ribosome-binding factor A|nr:30S ribosome-binding factor RbfA [Puniceicoccales bacterium]
MSARTTRRNEIMLRELSTLLHRHFPKESTLLTLTRVSIDDDLQHGRVFFSTPDENSRKHAEQFFKDRQSRLKYLLSQRVPLRKFPELYFCYDPSLGKELRINEVLDSMPHDTGN